MLNTIPDPLAPLNRKLYPPVYDAFLNQARRHPQVVALHSDDGDCTYEALERISHQIADRLCAGGVRPKSEKVVIFSDRNPALIYAILGVLRSGAAFSIADSAYPAAKIIKNLQVLTPTTLLVCGNVVIPETLLAYCNQQKSISIINIPASIKGATESLRQFGREPLDGEVDAEDMAYVSFTSGSTGQSKAISVTHDPLVHFINWHVDQHHLTATDRFSMLSGLSHDPLLREIFTPLSIGATLYIPKQASVFDPIALFEWLKQQQISVCHLTPGLGEIISVGAERTGLLLEKLRFLFWGGDALSQKTCERLLKIAPNATQVNFYGASETPQAMGYYIVPLRAKSGVIPIGRGIHDVQLLIVIQENRLADMGEVGEIWVRTPYLSKGYLNDPELTRTRFVTNPFSKLKGDVCYRTGDMGKFDEDGNVIFLGRIDHQIKIRGFRIEPAEVSRTIESFDNMKHAVVIAVEGDSGLKKLVAYYMCTEDVIVDNAALLKYLRAQLPEYMVPSILVSLKAIPLLPNGKVDYQSLPYPTLDDPHRDLTAPITEIEQRLLDQIKQHLDFYTSDVSQSFSDLGGDSLSYIRVSMAVERILGWLPENWDRLSIAELATMKKDQRNHNQIINTSVLARAISIVVIVLVHFKAIGMVGMTSALFVLAGWSFGRYQINTIYKSQCTQSAWMLILKIALPTALFMGVQQYFMHTTHLASFLFMDNLFDPYNILHKQYRYYWFINVLLQILVMVSLLFAIKPIRKYAYHHQFMFGFLGVISSWAIAYCGIMVWDIYLAGLMRPTSDYGIGQLPHLKLWLFFLGIAIASSNTFRQKYLIATLLLVFFLVTRFLFKTPIYITITSMPLVLLIIFKDKIEVPPILATIINNIAGASLMIYLGDKAFRHFMKPYITSINPFLTGVATILLCILLWYVWEFLFHKLLVFSNTILNRLGFRSNQVNMDKRDDA